MWSTSVVVGSGGGGAARSYRAQTVVVWSRSYTMVRTIAQRDHDVTTNYSNIIAGLIAIPQLQLLATVRVCIDINYVRYHWLSADGARRISIGTNLPFVL